METYRRRIVSIGALVVVSCGLVALLPVLLPLIAVIDVLARTRWGGVRFLCMVLVYLACELLGVLASLGLTLFVRDPERWLETHYRLQWWWASSLLSAVRRLFGMCFEVEGAELCTPGPILLLVRHVSTADTLLPAALVSSRFRLRLRYVLKRELLWDPCLDIVGQRLPNAFVRRGSGDTAGDVAAVQRLMEHLGPRDGVLIFPEGTRFSERRREEILAKLRTSATSELFERVSGFRHVLPPRLGGTLGLLEKNEGADIVFCAHTGFEGVRRMSDLWNGRLVAQKVRVFFWRCPWKSVPLEQQARTTWLLEEWQRMDAWIGEHSR